MWICRTKLLFCQIQKWGLPDNALIHCGSPGAGWIATPYHWGGVTGEIFTLDTAFRRGVCQAGLNGVRFHDLRRTVITRMAENYPM